MTRVFSVRNHAKRAAPKTFERALPFAEHMTAGAGCAVLAVDGTTASLWWLVVVFGCDPLTVVVVACACVRACADDPGAWDVSVRHHVIPISPFQPLNNSHDHLLHVVSLIERAAHNFFAALHARLPPVAPSPVPLALSPTARPGGLDTRPPTSPLLPASPTAEGQAMVLATPHAQPRKVDRRVKSLIKSLTLVDIVQSLAT